MSNFKNTSKYHTDRRNA